MAKEQTTTKDSATIAKTDAKTLSESVKVVGLVESLQSKEPFTVFKAIDAVFSLTQLEVDNY